MAMIKSTRTLAFEISQVIFRLLPAKEYQAHLYAVEEYDDDEALRYWRNVLKEIAGTKDPTKVDLSHAPSFESRMAAIDALPKISDFGKDHIAM